MERPYVFCHMLTSIDGKITGSYMDTPEGKAAGAVFDSIAFGKNAYYKHQGWLSGKVTTDDNFTFYEKPQIDISAPVVPDGDFIAQSNAGMYYVSVDLSGKLGWKKNTVTYAGTIAHVIEILTKKASNAYKAFLRKLGISYIIAGESSLDYEILMHKLKSLFHIETLMLGGGGVLNWSFIRSGMCDELSIVIAAAADGASDTPSLFEARAGLSDAKAMGFELKSADIMDGGSLWLCYKIKNK